MCQSYLLHLLQKINEKLSSPVHFIHYSQIFKDKFQGFLVSEKINHNITGLKTAGQISPCKVPFNKWGIE